jgi:hypothetical protein
MTLTAIDILTKEFGDSRNSFTPTILSRELVAPNVAVELSEGNAADGQPIWGVSVAGMRPDGSTYRTGYKADEPIHSSCFPSRAAAEAHVAVMRAHLAPPTSKSWKAKLLPAERARLRLERSFTAAEWAAMQRGSIPEAMEDKWFIYEKNGRLSFHRSWTGVCVFRVRFRKRGTGMEIVEAWVNRKTDQYSCVDDRYDAGLVLWLIDVLLLKRPAEFPDTGLPEGPGLMKRWSDVGRAGFDP